MSDQATFTREPVALDSSEDEAMDALLGVMHTITRDWGMTQNGGELASAVHVLQGFIIQHMLHRLNPEGWSSWREPVTTDERSPWAPASDGPQPIRRSPMQGSP